MSGAGRLPTIVSSGRTVTHRAMHERAARAASGIVAAGIEPGSAIALLLRNDVAMFEASEAARRAGGFAVPINTNASSDDIAFILRDCGAKALVAHADLIASKIGERIRSAIPAHGPILIVGRQTSDGTTSWDDWITRHEPLAAPVEGGGPPVIYTSGTTGRPKGVRRPKQSTGSQRALGVYGFDRPAPIKVLVNGPLYHSVPNAYARLALQVGADIVLEAGFDPEATLAQIARHGITHMHIVPFMMVRLLRLPADVRRRYDLSSLRYVVHGAAPCPRAIKTAMIDWFGPIVHEYYGSTETGLLTVHGSDEAVARPGTVGRALPGIELRIFDGDGRDLPPGEAGEIYAGSATMHEFLYIGDADKRADAGRGDLVTAGDIGWLDADGYLFLHDRKGDVIRCGDTQVFPARIEAALLDLPIVDCAIIGLPDARCGEIVCACIHPMGQADIDAVRTRVAAEARIAKRDVRVEIVDDLPREDSGKIFKQRLRERFS